jgi:hypothetical protein
VTDTDTIFIGEFMYAANVLFHAIPATYDQERKTEQLIDAAKTRSAS